MASHWCWFKYRFAYNQRPSKGVKVKSAFFTNVIKVYYKTWTYWVNDYTESVGYGFNNSNFFLHNLKGSQCPAHQHDSLPGNLFLPLPSLPPPSGASLRSVPSHQLAIAIPTIWSQSSVSLSHQLSIYFKISSGNICFPHTHPFQFPLCFYLFHPLTSFSSEKPIWFPSENCSTKGCDCIWYERL